MSDGVVRDDDDGDDVGVLMITITMMMLSTRTNNKKNAVAGAQVKQAASRCDAVVVALMNDLLLGAKCSLTPWP